MKHLLGNLGATEPEWVPEGRVARCPELRLRACGLENVRVTCRPTSAGFNVFAVFSLSVSTLDVCWGSRLTRCDLTPHWREAAILSYKVNVYQAFASAPSSAGSHALFLFPLEKSKTFKNPEEAARCPSNGPSAAAQGGFAQIRCSHSSRSSVSLLCLWLLRPAALQGLISHLATSGTQVNTPVSSASPSPLWPRGADGVS